MCPHKHGTGYTLYNSVTDVLLVSIRIFERRLRDMRLFHWARKFLYDLQFFDFCILRTRDNFTFRCVPCFFFRGHIRYLYI